MHPKILRITTRNARFQEWQALLANRRKRQRSGEFIVQGVRPVTLAIAIPGSLSAPGWRMPPEIARNGLA